MSIGVKNVSFSENFVNVKNKGFDMKGTLPLNGLILSKYLL